MKRTSRDVAQLIDISAVQAPRGEAEIRDLVASAKQEHFVAVHVLPCWVPFLKGLLAGSGILIGAPVGFPGGAHRTEIKAAEALLLVQGGVPEMDMMLNVGKLRSGEDRCCEDDIRSGAAGPDTPIMDLTEPLFAAKLEQGKEDAITRCTVCDNCIEFLIRQKPVGCSMYEREYSNALKEKATGRPEGGGTP